MITRISRWFAYASGIALLLMGLLGVADIIGIHVFAHPVPGMLEITSALMVASIFLGLAWTEVKGRHVRVEVLLTLLPPRIRRLLDAFGSLCLAVFFLFVVWFGALSFWRSVEKNEYAQGLIQVPLWPPRLLLVLGSLLLAIQALRSARLLLAGKPRESQAEGDTGGDPKWMP